MNTNPNRYPGRCGDPECTTWIPAGAGTIYSDQGSHALLCADHATGRAALPRRSAVDTTATVWLTETEIISTRSWDAHTLWLLGRVPSGLCRWNSNGDDLEYDERVVELIENITKLWDDPTRPAPGTVREGGS